MNLQAEAEAKEWWLMGQQGEKFSEMDFKTDFELGIRTAISSICAPYELAKGK